MNHTYQINQLHRWMNEFLSYADAGALITDDNEILALRYENLADIGTLNTTALTVAKYFSLKDGEAVILNDPYSGGSLLSTISIVTPLLFSPTPVFWILRTGFKPRLVISEKLDEEGLRIPPTPLIQNRKLNSAILAAISEHPFCPPGFEERLKQIMPKMWSRIDAFRNLLEKDKDLFSKSNLKNYQKYFNNWLKTTLNDYPQGDSKVELSLDKGELIRLHAELTDSHLQLDFSGTSASKRMCLTDGATLGACVGALSAFLQKNLPINSGILSCINVSAPLGSLLNSKYPSPTFKGMTDGTSLVASTVLMALSKIIPSKRLNMSASSPTMISFEFNSKVSFFDSIYGGSGASSSGDGTDSIQYWIRNSLQPSVEEIERRYPLIIRQIRIRQGSGGKGQYRGGHGVTKEFELLQPAVFNWIMEQKKNIFPSLGQKGIHPGHSPDILIQKKSGDEIKIQDSEGRLNLEVGDRIYVSSGGGCGFGKA